MKITVRLSVSEVARMVGKPLSTLYRWRRDEPKLFAIVWRGCLEIKLDKARA